MYKNVLWIDDSETELAAAQRMVSPLGRVRLLTARSSVEAERILRSEKVDTVVTDILRRNSDRSVSTDSGYSFFAEFVRPNWPKLPVIFHTKNLPGSFQVDEFAQYLSKWEPEVLKSIEIQTRLHSTTSLYEAFADQSICTRIEPRLVQVQRSLIARLERYSDIWQLGHSEFEELVAELLDHEGFDVLWIPGGSDQGIDIVAGCRSGDFLIDVKHYRETSPVTVELVRSVYAVASSVGQERSERPTYGGIITSSRFTRRAEAFRNSQRLRPLLLDSKWLQVTLSKYLPFRT